jgi:hypothetical protein
MRCYELLGLAGIEPSPKMAILLRFARRPAGYSHSYSHPCGLGDLLDLRELC